MRSTAPSALAAALLLAAFHLPSPSNAMTANPKPFKYTQPDGTSITLKQVGRPGRRLVVDVGGYTCIRHEHRVGDGIGGEEEFDILHSEGGNGSDAPGDAEEEEEDVRTWYVYAALSPSGDGSLVSSGLRCGIDDPSDGGLERGIAPRVTYGERRQLEDGGGGSVPGFECGEYCHPDRAPRRRDIVEDLVHGGNGGMVAAAKGKEKEKGGGRKLERGDGGKEVRDQTLRVPRDPYSPELPADLPEAVPLERGGPAEQQLLPSASSPHPLASGRGLSGKKTLKNLVICFKFAGHDGRPVPSQEAITALMNAPPGTFPPEAPTGSVRNMFDRMSYGSFEIFSDVLPWVQLPHPYTEEYCAGGASGLTTSMHECIVQVLRIVDNADMVNWADYDVYENGGQGNGEIDSMALFHSGYAAEFDTGPDCYGRQAYDRIWSHEWSLGTNAFESKNYDSRGRRTRVNFYPINSAFWGTCGEEIARIGVICHEMAHFLGLYDLYDLRGDENGYYGYGIGQYGLMGNAWGHDYSQLYSRPLCPWSRFSLGWMVPHVISSSGTYSLSPSYDEPDVMIITHNFPTGEYLILENCHEDYQPYARGMIVYHVDNSVYDLDNPANTAPVYNEFDGYPGQPGWPDNGKHYRVAVVQADGNYHLEQGFNEGDPFDVYSKCWIDEIAPSRQQGPPGPYPNTDSYQRGNVAKTGVRVHNIGFPGPQLTFSVDLDSSHEASQAKLMKRLLPQWSNPVMREHFTTWGTMFHVQAKQRDVSVVGIDINADFTDVREVTVYALPKGAFVTDGNNPYDPAAWGVPVFRGPIQGRGLACRTPIDLPRHFPLSGGNPSGEIQGFYVTFDGNGDDVLAVGYPDPAYQEVDLSRTARAAEDDLLSVTYGLAKVPPLDTGSVYRNVKPNVVIRYAEGLNGVPPTPAPTPSPTLPPVQPTPAPIPRIEERTGEDKALSTTFAADNQATGNMFDVYAQRDIRIKNFSVHADDSHAVTVKVYHKEGSHAGAEDDLTQWGPPMCLATVDGAHAGNSTEISAVHCSPRHLLAGTTHSFYITFERPSGAPRSMKMLYTAGVGTGTVHVENGDLRIFQGIGKGETGLVYRDRIWNGIVHYTAL